MSIYEFQLAFKNMDSDAKLDAIRIERLRKEYERENVRTENRSVLSSIQN